MSLVITHMDTISNIKHMEGVDRVMWSEEVYRVPVASENILSSFKKVWNNSTNHNNKYIKEKNNNSKVNNGNTKHFYYTQCSSL
jgi:hypothetical protein